MTVKRTRTSHIEVDDVLHELATILLFQADQLAATANRSIAEDFIGISLGSAECAFRDLPTSYVELRRFPIARVFRDAVSFVARPHPDHVMGDDVYRLAAFMFHSPRSGLRSAVSRKQQFFMRPWGRCRTVADAAMARLKLEVDRRGDFTLRELALLADITDNAAQKSLERWCREQRPDVFVSSYSTLQVEEAMGWLSAQPGFRSSWDLSENDPHVRDRLTKVRSVEDLHDFVQAHRGFSAPLRKRTTEGNSSAELDAWERGGFAYEPKRAAAFARSLGLDVPLFSGKVLEISLRQSEKNVDVAPHSDRLMHPA